MIGQLAMRDSLLRMILLVLSSTSVVELSSALPTLEVVDRNRTGEHTAGVVRTMGSGLDLVVLVVGHTKEAA